jgi:predicted PolB exonuclease-like 3'-5' exonuclease
MALTFDPKCMENVPQMVNKPVSYGGETVDSITLYEHFRGWNPKDRADFLRHYTHAIVWHHNRRVEFIHYNDDGTIQRCYISFV